MKNIVFALCVGLSLSLCVSCGGGASGHEQRSYNEGINVIPLPQTLVPQQGRFVLKNGLVLGASTPKAKHVAQYFADKIAQASGYTVFVKDQGDISLVLDGTIVGDEAYSLQVTPEKVSIAALTEQGLFYGMQTFMQLLPAEIESRKKMEGIDWSAPAVSISDSPRFSYRGLHVDPCRHFMTVEEMKRQIDVLALFKINRLHWHLTEDQGWRIEIKKYPRLVEIGSRRIDGEGIEYGGFYTQEEVKDIVKYAEDRFITIVPEIELPGHELAAIAAYPELSCTGEDITPRVIWGVEDIVMCPGKELMFEFLEDVFDEIIELFPGQYIHIGGDECPKSSWEACVLCQKRIRELGLKSDAKHTAEQRLQSYVVQRMEKYLATKGKRIIGWDEILEGGLAETATVMSWRGEEGGIAAALAEHDVIMCPGSKGYYLDFYQGDSKIEPVSIGGYSSLETTYSFNPVPDILTVIGKEKYILGVQANVWSEYLYTNDLREYMTFPRALAMAETAWTSLDRKDYKDFERRINNAYVRLDGHGINYHIPLPEQPGGSCNRVAFIDSVSLVFTTSRPEVMVYTLDGSEPDAQSATYSAPIIFKNTGTLKIATLLPSGKLSPVRTIEVEKQEPVPAQKREVKTPGLEVKYYDGMYLDMKAFEAAKPEVLETKVARSMRELTSYRRVSESMRGVAQYAAIGMGYIYIPKDDVYFVSSNLEEVWMDGKLLVNNSGEVKRYSRHDNSIALTEGLHEIKVVFLGHVIGGWPSNWNDGSVLLRRSGENEFKAVKPEDLWH